MTNHESNIDVGVILDYAPGRGATRPTSIGQGACLRSGTVLYAGSVIGERLQTGHNVVIREGNHLGNDVSIWSNSVVDYDCRIGNRVKIHCGCYISQGTLLEDDAFLAPGVSLANDLYPGDAESASRMRGPTIRAGAQIGVNVTILPYVVIGARALVGSGSVVTHDLPPDCVAYGNPARPHGVRSDLRDIAERVATAGTADVVATESLLTLDAPFRS